MYFDQEWKNEKMGQIDWDYGFHADNDDYASTFAGNNQSSFDHQSHLVTSCNFFDFVISLKRNRKSLFAKVVGQFTGFFTLFTA
jgi:arabinogalactan endo-1,4-beta-galactosidase